MKNEKYLKERFLEEADKAMEDGIPNTAFSYEMIAALRDMAEADVYPDGRFGDDHCLVWSMFRDYHCS